MTRRQVLLLVTYLLGVFMGALDMGIISPALTTIISDIGASPQWSIWIVTAYSLVYAMGMPAFGKLSDRYGRKSVYIAGVAIFGVGSLLSGMSHTIAELVAARIVQGFGAGGIFPVATAAMGDAFPPERRGLALGMVGGVYGLASVIGPNVGGLLINHLSWHAIFYVSVPVAVVILVMSAGLQADRSAASATSPLDLAGVLAVSATIVAFMFGLTNLDPMALGASLGHADVYLPFLAGLALLPLVWALERRARDPVLPAHLVRDGRLLGVYALTILSNATMVAMLFLPGYAQNLLSVSAGTSGYIVSILAVATFISAPLGGSVIRRFGAARVLALGFLLSAAGLFAVRAAGGLSGLLAGLFILGLGMGFTAGAPLNYLVIDAAGDHERGTALAVQRVFGSLGMVLVPTVMASILGARMQEAAPRIGGAVMRALTPYLASHPQAMAALAPLRRQFESTQMISGSALLAALPPGLRAPFAHIVLPVIRNAAVTGFRAILVLAIALAGLGVVLSLVTREQHRASAAEQSAP